MSLTKKKGYRKGKGKTGAIAKTDSSDFPAVETGRREAGEESSGASGRDKVPEETLISSLLREKD